MVSHHLDGFLRATAAGLLHPAASHEVRLVSPDPVPSFHPEVSLATWTRFLAARFIPFKGFPSSAAVPHHCGRCPLIVGCQSPRSCLDAAFSEERTARRELSCDRSRCSGVTCSEEWAFPALTSTEADASASPGHRSGWRCEDPCFLVMMLQAAEAALHNTPRLAVNHRSGRWLRPRYVTG